MVARSLAKIRPRMSTARARSLATSTTLRSTRSARTPASGLAMVGKRRATSAPPTAEALPVIWTTSITSATIETASPTKEVPCPIQSRKKRPFRRRESLVESMATDLAFGREQPDADPVVGEGIQRPISPYFAREFHGHRARCCVFPSPRPGRWSSHRSRVRPGRYTTKSQVRATTENPTTTIRNCQTSDAKTFPPRHTRSLARYTESIVPQGCLCRNKVTQAPRLSALRRVDRRPWVSRPSTFGGGEAIRSARVCVACGESGCANHEARLQWPVVVRSGGILPIDSAPATEAARCFYTHSPFRRGLSLSSPETLRGSTWPIGAGLCRTSPTSAPRRRAGEKDPSS